MLFKFTKDFSFLASYISVAETLKVVTTTMSTTYQPGTVSGEGTPVSGTSGSFPFTSTWNVAMW
jgi:hypothetical protein